MAHDGSFAGSMEESDEDLRLIYGPNAHISRVGRFTLVHLDSPSMDEVARRVAEFDPNQFFFDDCPLCVRPVSA